MKRIYKLIKNALGKYEPQEVLDIKLRQDILDLKSGSYTFKKGDASVLVFVEERINCTLYMFGGLGLYINLSDGSLCMAVMDGKRLNENFGDERPIIENLYTILSTYECERV